MSYSWWFKQYLSISVTVLVLQDTWILDFCCVTNWSVIELFVFISTDWNKRKEFNLIRHFTQLYNIHHVKLTSTDYRCFDQEVLTLEFFTILKAQACCCCCCCCFCCYYLFIQFLCIKSCNYQQYPKLKGIKVVLTSCCQIVVTQDNNNYHIFVLK